MTQLKGTKKEAMAKRDTAVEKDLWHNRLYTVLLVMQYKGEDATKTHRGTRHWLQRWRHRMGPPVAQIRSPHSDKKEVLHGKVCAHADTHKHRPLVTKMFTPREGPGKNRGRLAASVSGSLLRTTIGTGSKKRPMFFFELSTVDFF